MKVHSKEKKIEKKEKSKIIITDKTIAVNNSRIIIPKGTKIEITK